jgi:hypothetical protein
MIALALAAWLAAPALPHPLAAPGDDFHWQGKLAAGQTIRIQGINGAIHASAATGAEVVVSATKRARKSDPDDVKIEVVTGTDGVTICAVYPGRHGKTNRCDGEGHNDQDTENNDTEVEFTVAVPVGVLFEGGTVNGDVDAIGLDADATASTVNGSVEVSTKGRAEASTVNGSIRATVGKTLVSDADFSTVNGGITLTMPADLACEFKANTVNGSIDSDFPITVTGRMNPSSLRGTIGAGGHRLSLNTVNGSIRLRKS